MDIQQEIESLLKRPNLRSADRANLRRMLETVRRGRPLTTQDRENFWAYRTRYVRAGGQG
jgi:hypothetical protein